MVLESSEIGNDEATVSETMYFKTQMHILHRSTTTLHDKCVIKKDKCKTIRNLPILNLIITEHSSFN